MVYIIYYYDKYSRIWQVGEVYDNKELAEAKKRQYIKYGYQQVSILGRAINPT